MTQEELDKIPQVGDVVLWQEEDEPTSVIDSQGVAWIIGWFQGVLYKRRHGRR
jgi:hypothetical protein